MQVVYSSNGNNRPHGFIGKLFAGIIIGLLGFVMRLVMRRVFNISVQKTQRTKPNKEFEPSPNYQKPLKPTTNQPVEEADWRPV